MFDVMLHVASAVVLKTDQGNVVIPHPARVCSRDTWVTRHMVICFGPLVQK